MSNELKEQAKKIIAKGKMLNDPELIKMGLDMLETYGSSKDHPVETDDLKNKINYTAGKFDMGQFAMQKTSSTLLENGGRKQPIYIGTRDNKFLDDGVEYKDIKTPEVSRAERSRKPISQQLVEQKCQICGKIEKVLPLYAREFYRCETCLLKGKS